MFPTGSSAKGGSVPYVTYTLLALNVILFLWDRQWNPLAPQGLVFGDLAMRPSDVSGFWKGDSFPLITLFTSLFLHGSLLHLVSNMIYLLCFGDAVEEALGPFRYVLYYLFWGIVAGATHIFVDPGSTTQVIGASGAIGGVLGCYFLLFPASKIEVWVFFLTFDIDAWILLGLWFVLQIVAPQAGVANWAHAGGFMAGMLTVLILGGKAKVLAGREKQFEQELGV
jgi:membrane associated rhomboid family serine protease